VKKSRSYPSLKNSPYTESATDTAVITSASTGDEELSNALAGTQLPGVASQFTTDSSAENTTGATLPMADHSGIAFDFVDSSSSSGAYPASGNEHSGGS
jgi:hypothetical protein